MQLAPKWFRTALVILLAVTSSASTASAARRAEPRSRTAAEIATRATGFVAAPAHAESGPSTVIVNPTWTATPPTKTVGANTYTFGVDAFATIQAGINTVAAGGTVMVMPGTYNESAPGSYLRNGSGPYQFGLFVSQYKTGITVEGVDNSGAPITSAAVAGVTTVVNYNASNGFGYSGIYVEPDGVTFQGLGIGSNQINYTQKTFESRGDTFTLQSCYINDDGGDVYIGDDAATPTSSHVQSYHILNNVFTDGNTMEVTSGPGINGPAAGRVISGNSFTMSDIYNSIVFNGTGGQPWYAYPVGGAVISGNSFVNTNAAGTIVKARGTYDNTQFDWATIWNGNTYNRATCEGAAPPANLRAYAYGVYTNVRRIEATVQGEVDNAVAGDVVLLHAGSYTEQVVVNGKNVSLQGAGAASTSIVSPATLTASYTTSEVNKPVVLCESAADIELHDLTVDGAGMGNANYRFQGVGFWNAGGKMMNCGIVRVRETPFNGDQHGVGIYTYNNTGGPYALEVGGCTLTDFQKNAMALSGNGLTVNVHDCTVTGQGPTTLNAENGIQVSYGASGTLSNNTISALNYTPNTDAACAVLVYAAGTVSVTGGSISSCQSGVYFEDASGSVNGVPITGSMWAATLYNDNATLAANRAAMATGTSPHVLPQPVLEPAAGNRPLLAALGSSYNFTIAGGCITGSGVAGSQGIWAGSNGGAVSASISGAEITNWDQGIATYGPAVVTATHNSITGCLTAGFDNSAGGAGQAATLNWWGNAGGPGVGGANPVLGTGVTYAPWLITGTDLNPGCGFTALADNTVTPGPAPSCISIVHPCVTIPVTIARTSSDNVRGFSVTFHLSSNLQLCSGTSSVAEGTYLHAIASTHYEVVDNGGGSYTADCAILGGTCGATGTGGLLFSLAVAKVATLGTGTITIDAVVLRDCDNNPVASSIGSPLNVTIDDAAPVAIANLASTQLKSGNGTSNRTRVQLSFTAPPDAATIEVWRAPFGHYPEYNQQGGAVPTVPASYPPSGAWTVTGVTASGQTDTPPARDFWYYVAYSWDGCGNRSVVSNLTAGSLDYHLGDVVDPNNGLAQGDNSVDGADISRLGAHYGITLATPDTYDYLDVGPTTNYSVNARPSPDKKVSFEDLILFAINYGQVAAPQDAPRAQPAARDQVALSLPQLPAVGETFAVGVHLDAAGDVQGASARLAWDPAVVEPVAVEAGELLQSQAAPSIVLSPEPGTVDFALLGEGAALAGSGDAARVLFRVKASGDPAVTLASLTARGTQNQPVSFTALPGSTPGETPAKTELGPAYPNPFVHEAGLRLSLARAGAVRVALYDLAGRRVRTLMDSVQPAGVRIVRWDGKNDAGLRMAPGVYVMRLETPGTTQSRRLQFIP